MPFKANADRRHRIPKQRRRIMNWGEYDAASFSDRGCPVNSLLRHFSETGSSSYSIRLSRSVTYRVVAPSLILGADQCSRCFPDGSVIPSSWRAASITLGSGARGARATSCESRSAMMRNAANLLNGLLLAGTLDKLSTIQLGSAFLVLRNQVCRVNLLRTIL